MKGSISGIFLLLLLVSLCLKADSQRYNPGVILAVQIARQRSVEARAAVNRVIPRDTDAPLKEALRNCALRFDEATMNLEVTVDELRKGIFTNAPRLVDQALRAGLACQAAPLADVAAAFRTSCSEALNIVNDAGRQP